MPEISDSALRRRYRRRGLIGLVVAGALGAAILVGWIAAGWDPQAVLGGGGTRGGLRPLWLSTIWIGVAAVGIAGYGVSQLRAAALFTERDPDRRP